MDAYKNSVFKDFSYQGYVQHILVQILLCNYEVKSFIHWLAGCRHMVCFITHGIL